MKVRFLGSIFLLALIVVISGCGGANLFSDDGIDENPSAETSTEESLEESGDGITWGSARNTEAPSTVNLDFSNCSWAFSQFAVFSTDN